MLFEFVYKFIFIFLNWFKYENINNIRSNCFFSKTPKNCNTLNVSVLQLKKNEFFYSIDVCTHGVSVRISYSYRVIYISVIAFAVIELPTERLLVLKTVTFKFSVVVRFYSRFTWIRYFVFFLLIPVLYV